MEMPILVKNAPTLRPLNIAAPSPPILPLPLVTVTHVLCVQEDSCSITCRMGDLNGTHHAEVLSNSLCVVFSTVYTPGKNEKYCTKSLKAECFCEPPCSDVPMHTQKGRAGDTTASDKSRVCSCSTITIVSGRRGMVDTPVTLPPRRLRQDDPEFQG